MSVKSTFTLTAGTGIHYRFSDHFTFFVDAKVHFAFKDNLDATINNSDDDILFTPELGFIYHFETEVER